MYRPLKKQLITSFQEQFKKSHENLKIIISQSHINDLDQKSYPKFCAGCFTKKVITASFVQHFKENPKTYNMCLLRSGNINGNMNIIWYKNTSW